MRLTRTAATLVVILVLLLGGTATAQDFDRTVLGAIDTVPTRAELDAAFPDARDRLEAAAGDDTHGFYARQRAITLLSLYPDARTRSFLEALLAHPDAEVRKIAVYTLGRGFGAHADARLVTTIAGVIRGDQPLVQEWAVRSLRWIAHEDARRLLREIAAGSDTALARLATRALRRSAEAPAQ